jgi:tRNA(fMet)-specific endonuclease VapC
MIVADTDVLIDSLRGGGSRTLVAQHLESGRLATTAISVFELWQGVQGKRAAEALETLLDACQLLALDADAARLAGTLRAQLREAGSDIGPTDSLVAGICMSRGATLLTRNRMHFERVPGLLLADPGPSPEQSGGR